MLMPTIQVNVSTRDLLAAVEQLSQPELEQFALEVIALCAARTAGSASPVEAQLVERIHHAVPEELLRRSRELDAKRRAETLTPAEHVELLHLTDEIEHRSAERVWALGKLARLRKKPLDAVMEEFGIQPPPWMAERRS